MALGPNQRATMRHASEDRTRKHFEHVAAQWRHGRWLSVGNRYMRDTVRRLEADVRPGQRIRAGQLGRYIAASSVIHCSDGWSLVARAMEAAALGDVDAATHFAYYAELRAAMSILAASGVGVFHDKHFVIDRDGECHRINGQTHAFVWDALSEWAEQPQASNLVLQVVQPGGLALTEWLRHFSATMGSSTSGRLANQWLLDWGMDIRKFGEDRTARNESSYRPTSIARVRRVPFLIVLRFLERFWIGFEPSSTNPFRVIDRYLLRRSLAVTFSATRPNNTHPRRAPKTYLSYVKKLLVAVAPGDLRPEEWEKFLNFDGSQTENAVLVTAEGRTGSQSAMHHLEVLARSVLLLRIATGASRRLVTDRPEAEVKHLAFWWHSLGEDRGFWKHSSIPADLGDLWKDVEETLVRARDWRASGGTAKSDFFALLPDAIRTLSSCERVALWGLGL